MCRSLLIVLILGSVTGCAFSQEVETRAPTSWSRQLTPAEMDYIAATGFIWGYLKYHHPYLYEDCLEWDNELIAVLDAIDRSNATKSLRSYLEPWISKTSLQPLSQYSSRQSTKWEIAVVQRPPTYQAVGVNIDSILTDIERTSDVGEQKCVQYQSNSTPNANFDQDTAHSNLENLDVGHRLLSLVRYWNMVEYWFPYRDLIDEDWHLVLRDSVPAFYGADTRFRYRQALLQLIARIRDTHANLWTASVVS